MRERGLKLLAIMVLRKMGLGRSREGAWIEIRIDNANNAKSAGSLP